MPAIPGVGAPGLAGVWLEDAPEFAGGVVDETVPAAWCGSGASWARAPNGIATVRARSDRY
ncbi:MAG TPA: hypothetical protein VED46_09455 [Alphaproteobacteria bacterium]|nr:hypothetical protein [Alphaproteobacteria bacterium]